MKKFNWKSIIPLTLFLVALLLFLSYLIRNAAEFKQLLDLSVTAVLTSLGLTLTFAMANGLMNYVFYRGLHVPLTLNESFGMATVNTLANQLPFAGGLIAKGVYLKKRHALSYTCFLSTTLTLYVCFVAANGVIGLTVLAYWALIGDGLAPLLLIVGFSAMVASVILLWLPFNAIPIRLPDRLKKYLTQLVDGWEFLSKNKLLLIQLIGLQIVTTVLFAARFWIAFHALSQEVTWAQCLLFSAATVLTRLANIVPGGLGVREGIVAGVAVILGFQADASIAAVGLDRLIATVVIVALGVPYTYILSKNATLSPKSNDCE